MLWTQETHCQQHELSRYDAFTPGHFGHFPTAVRLSGPLDLHGANALHVAFTIVNERLGKNLVVSRILAKLGGCLFVSVISPKDPWPFGPGVIVGALLGWLGQEFKIDHLAATVANRCADAIGARIAATNHHHIFPFGANERAVEMIAVNPLGVRCEELHGGINASQFASRDGQIARFGGTAS